LPHADHEQTLVGGGGGDGVDAGVAAAATSPGAGDVLSLALLSTGSLWADAWAAPMATPAAAVAAAAQVRHLRDSAGFFSWLPEKPPRSLSSPQQAHSMALWACVAEVGWTGAPLLKRWCLSVLQAPGRPMTEAAGLRVKPPVDESWRVRAECDVGRGRLDGCSDEAVPAM